MRVQLDPGTVALVAGGPGDPDLLTVAACRALEQADVVLYDYLAPDVSGLVRPGTELIAVGKRPRSTDTTSQDSINALLVELAKAGRRVVRLKGGDNYVFGRGGEEWLHCAEAEVPVIVIPGVTSATAAPAFAGIPVTHRTLSQGFTVVSGHAAPGHPSSSLDWRALARSGTTLVLLMGVKNLAAIAAELQAGGLASDTPASIVSSAFGDTAAVVRGTLDTIAALAIEAGIKPPSIVVIGAVAALDLT
ncbi:MAG: uroporphyrinogen-III C-methyltransferase [Propioniciclava sp.]|uniref:uroporphyrinogen-III C-methyltransferase n=1 Tax=Propioniciclava sp. TaxID=2038686 RepID=UPI0039E29E70